VQRLLLTDDELWQAIAENTDAMSTLVHERLELEADASAPNNRDSRAMRIRSNAHKIDRFEHQYQDYAAELRRRHA
jgi:hypothetical protein